MTVTAMTPQAAAAAATPAEPAAKKSKKKLIIILVAVLVLGGGGYKVFGPKKAGPPKPGIVVTLDPIQINLADSHYLRIGVALQLVKGVKEADGSKALDSAITLFSGLPMAEVNDTKKRATLKKQLEDMLAKAYEKDVMGVYFTEFVTQ